jgi:hypothetical protein
MQVLTEQACAELLPHHEGHRGREAEKVYKDLRDESCTKSEKAHGGRVDITK